MHSFVFRINIRPGFLPSGWIGVFILLALAATALAQPLPSGTRLKESGFLVGATAEIGLADKEGLFNWKDAAKVGVVIDREFNLLQTTAYPAWDTWTGTGMNNVAFNLANTNRVINRAKEKGQKTVVHLLAGSPTYFPAWMNQASPTPTELEALLSRWITFAMNDNENRLKVDYWNVVNEAFMWNGKYWDSSSAANTNPWDKMGWEEDKSGLTGTAKVYARHPVYIRRAFEMARQHSTAKLELRDYGIEFWDGSVKTRAFYQLVKHLLNSGAPIDAIGFQGHFRTDITYDWSKLKQAVEEYRKLGLEVYLTEIDFGDKDPAAAAGTAHRTAAFDSIQAEGYYQLAKNFVAGGGSWLCLWGVADNSNQYWRMGQSALLFDESYAAKKAYESFRKGITDGMAPSTSIRRKRGGDWSHRQFRKGVHVEAIKAGYFDVLGKSHAYPLPIEREAESSH